MHYYSMPAISADDLTQLIHSFSFLNDVNKRVYWLYLVSGLFIVVAVSWNRKSRLKHIFRATFSIKYWFNDSCYSDYKWILINQIVKFLLLIPILASSISVSLYVNRLLKNTFGDGNFLHWPQLSVVIIFSIVLFITDDFSRFWLHRLYHRVPFLWRFHSIHHSATVLTPLTLYRVHSVEFFFNNCRGIVVTGGMSGLFMYCFDGSIGVYEVLGVNVFNAMFNLTAANLRHSHVWIGFGKFEHVFISPAQHQIHHSKDPKHFNKNYGSCLSLWDKAYKSWQSSKNNKVSRFGL